MNCTEATPHTPTAASDKPLLLLWDGLVHTLSQFDAKPNEGPAFGFGLDLEILPPAKPSLLVLVSLSLAPAMLLSFLIAIVFYVSRGPAPGSLSRRIVPQLLRRCLLLGICAPLLYYPFVSSSLIESPAAGFSTALLAWVAVWKTMDVEFGTA
eukprot:CAMPEP_0119490142 /NCGR_PEP_ID=MMETSP1344-20130328/15399_1 /TAXON_ID=236787 /ORGANISM="Florenciella parvula, Strain CCMP2471" /LENGTH=152 /DNA_ID=CAMNT_0007525255 /DNA_START=90 /DNA_END=545 /DNA_ORIENTATION=+